MSNLLHENIWTTKKGYSFRLQLYDLQEQRGAQSVLGYRLDDVTQDKPTPIFGGIDFCVPHEAKSNKEIVKVAMAFLTLRPGDIDGTGAHFRDFGDTQLKFCSTHAADLQACVEKWWERENPLAENKNAEAIAKERRSQ